MNTMRYLILFYLFLVAQPAFAGNIIPTIDELKTWAQKNATGKIEFYDSKNIKEIYLTNKEIAYLLPVSLDNEGRNGMFQTALAIPAKKEIILLVGTVVKDVIEILDLDKNQLSEIIVKNSASGQGSEIGEKAIVQINDLGEPIILHKISFENDEGAYGQRDYRYYMKDAKWKFFDINGDGNNDLIETRIVHEGRNKRSPKITKQVYRYIFDGSCFVRFRKNKIR